MNKKLLTALVTAAVSASANANLVIDDFSASQGVVSTSSVGSSAVSTISDASIYGSYRDIWVEKTSPASGIGASTSVTAQVSDGAYSFSAGSNSNGAGHIRWDGIGVNSFNLGLNLLTSGSQGSIDVYSSDANYPFTIKLFTSATKYSFLTLAAIGAPAPGYTKGIAYDLFFGAGDPLKIALETGVDGAVDLENVGAIEIIINDPTYSLPRTQFVDIDTTIDKVALVPEPATIALLGASLIGLAANRRRQKKQ